MLMISLRRIMPNPSIADRLAGLLISSKAGLCKLWAELFKVDPPPGIRKELMVRVLAYRLQEQEFGGLSEGSLGRLRVLAKTIDINCNASSRGPTIKPGTRLIRQWKDQVHVVHVEEGNYEYKGSRYQSLSEIARLITGTRWSGPLFFGLKSAPTERQEIK
jgi:hypothetical protein